MSAPPDRTALGLDCGGTSVVAISITGGAAAPLRSVGGPANWSTTPHDVFETSVREAVDAHPAPSRVVAGVAGAITPAERRDLADLLASVFGAGTKLDLGSDHDLAVLAAGDTATCVVIAGTGAIVCSRPGGERRWSGNGGYIFGDAGSAAAIARAAIEDLFFSGPVVEGARWPRLLERVTAVAGTDDRSGFLRWFYDQPAPAATLAAFAPAVVADDETRPNGPTNRNLGALAAIVARHLDHWHPHDERPEVALTGGLWKISDRLARRFGDELGRHRAGRTAPVRTVDVEPALAAARAAYEGLGDDG